MVPADLLLIFVVYSGPGINTSFLTTDIDFYPAQVVMDFMYSVTFINKAALWPDACHLSNMRHCTDQCMTIERVAIQNPAADDKVIFIGDRYSDFATELITFMRLGLTDTDRLRFVQAIQLIFIVFFWTNSFLARFSNPLNAFSRSGMLLS